MMAPMRVGLLLASMVVLSFSSAACGDDGGGAETGGSGTTGSPGTTEGSTGPELTGSSGGSASGSGTMDDGTATAADTTATSADGTSTAGETTAGTDDSTGDATTGDATTGSTTEGSTTEGGMGSLDAAISNLQIYQDCMPIVPFDPVDASFTLELTNPGDGPASATITSATFLDVGGVLAATIDVVPDAFGPIDGGDSVMMIVSKVADSMMPANGCETLQCGSSYTLELVLDVDGVEVIASETAQVGCVF
jgi:hypothetical protein